MQPPLPRKPAPHINVANDSGCSPASTHHPQEPADTAFDSPASGAGHLVGTRESTLVRAWADHQGAEPATGEATASGPATIDVNDQGTGLRFNFPGASRFREVSWEEWLEHFAAAGLVFVFEMAPPAGTQSGSRFGGAFYRIVPSSEWGSRPLATLAEADEADPQIGRA